jgi:hypothetical protein
MTSFNREADYAKILQMRFYAFPPNEQKGNLDIEQAKDQGKDRNIEIYLTKKVLQKEFVA